MVGVPEERAHGDPVWFDGYKYSRGVDRTPDAVIEPPGASGARRAPRAARHRPNRRAGRRRALARDQRPTAGRCRAWEPLVSSYLTFRILKGLFVVVLISVVTFVIMRLMPGDPVYMLLGEGQIPITDDQIAAIRAKWGLDRPLHVSSTSCGPATSCAATSAVADPRRRAGAPDDLRGHPGHRPAELLRDLARDRVAVPFGIAAAVRRNSLGRLHRQRSSRRWASPPRTSGRR
jgi:hypothetical protein